MVVSWFTIISIFQFLGCFGFRHFSFSVSESKSFVLLSSWTMKCSMMAACAVVRARTIHICLKERFFLKFLKQRDYILYPLWKMEFELFQGFKKSLLTHCERSSILLLCSLYVTSIVPHGWLSLNVLSKRVKNNMKSN